MVTMQDIADRVGVNRVTVSNVLNGRLASQRSDAAKRAAEIRRIAKEMGFRPSTAAKATRTGRTGFIGMIRSPRLACSVHAIEFDASLDVALNKRGLCLLRDTIDDSVGQEGVDATVPRIVREHAVDGLLVNYAFGTPIAVRDLIDRCAIPAIWINRKRENNCIYPNDEGAASEATRYLLEHGHRDVALLHDSSVHKGLANPEQHYSSADRRKGYETVMQGAGLRPRVELLDFRPDRTSQVEPYCPGMFINLFLTWLKQPNRPTAVLCSSAHGRLVVAAAWKLGLRVPEDLSVMSFDNNASADYEIAVDRVLVPYYSMGYAAVDELCSLIEQPEQSRRPVVLPFEFHRTGTVSRPTL